MHYPETKGLKEILNRVEDSLEKGLPFAIYRKPNENEVIGVYQATKALHYTSDFSEKGFVFAPFYSQDKVVLIQPDEYWKAAFKKEDIPINSDISLFDNDEETHIKLVENGVRAIKKGRLQKVVLSRKIEVSISRSPIEIFKTLLNRYPNAFGYLFHHPDVGTWCGATPETLVRIKDKELRTMSLAATLPYEENKSPQWGDKEVQEQQMVSEYIGDKLAHTVQRLEIDEAESVRAGGLWHLRSEVRGTMLPDLEVGKVIRALHPTPAVCGIPTAEAQQFIRANENYNRTFYTGFLGEINLNSQGELSLFVNLRCMEIKNHTASIFVGGGITEASDPKSEWIETQNKSKTMLGIL
ncbi:chorismate-binding protein [Flagellimonas okinawensis]|uniref:isochorismate synthase n=1 Tax=Flagellimonas okinawensis TaxID=3031324 RepID=A0ABT5XRA6_9FLAO|nr:chorismate-binding protein [[Muricauda] okinawensis]MDF0708428.1 chorismate-binding protein [[Muricauda] okinawensis]